jgi:site-specific recombinase XerD
MTPIAPTLQAFFTDRLAKQLHASPRTIASYRDSLRLLLCFANDRTGIAPSALDWDDLDESLIATFLEHLEIDRHNSPRTRNLRLTAIRALFRYAALRHPEHAAVIARVLSIPAKRFDRRIVTFLTGQESVALIEASPESRWEGRRDRAMLTLALHAGLRVSELIAINCADIQLGTGAHVRVEGKGRKQRAIPLTKDAQAVLATWLDERAGQVGRNVLGVPAASASVGAQGLEHTDHPLLRPVSNGLACSHVRARVHRLEDVLRGDGLGESFAEDLRHVHTGEVAAGVPLVGDLDALITRPGLAVRHEVRLQRRPRHSDRQAAGLQAIERTGRVVQALRGDVGVDGCRSDAPVSQQGLNEPQVRAGFQQVRGERVTQRADTGMFA